MNYSFIRPVLEYANVVLVCKTNVYTEGNTFIGRCTGFCSPHHHWIKDQLFWNSSLSGIGLGSVSLGMKEKDVGFKHVLYLAITINYNKKNDVIHSTHIAGVA